MRRVAPIISAPEIKAIATSRRGCTGECYHRRIVRKIGLLTATLFAATLHAPQLQPPVFRAVVAGPLLDRRGHLLTDLLLASGTYVLVASHSESWGEEITSSSWPSNTSPSASRDRSYY